MAAYVSQHIKHINPITETMKILAYIFQAIKCHKYKCFFEKYQ